MGKFHCEASAECYDFCNQAAAQFVTVPDPSATVRMHSTVVTTFLVCFPKGIETPKMVQFTTLLIIISNLESVLSQESWSNETMSTMSDQDYKTFGNSSDNFERERKFRSAIGYGLTFKKEVEELEKILIIRGLVTRTTEFNDFNSHYFSSSHDDTIQRLVHNGIANSAIVRYFTMQSYP